MFDLAKELIKVKNKRLLVVFPHPDDESVMAGGLIARAVSIGYEVTVICLTKGERGKIHINGRGRRSDEIREGEFFGAMRELSVGRFEIWDYPDGGLTGIMAWRKRLNSLIEVLDPGAVVTYDQSGITGHPDHIALSLLVFSTLKKMRTSVVLLWPVLFNKAKEMISEPRVADLVPEGKYRLDLSLSEVIRKWKAIASHESQGYQQGKMIWQFCLGWLLKHRYELYAKADLSKKYKHRYVKFKF